MPDSPLIAAGAQVQPTAAAPLHTNEFFTGMWTNGNPLGPGAVPYLYSKYWSASRFDRLIGGINLEVSTHLTPIRRPGSSIYNSQLFPPINRFFEWRGFSSTGEVIRLMASCDAPTGGPGGGTVRDATGPSTNIVLQTKAANAGRTSFVAVGNNLYWGDGVETGMLVQSLLSWTANTQYNPGDFIIDSNGNVQMAVGAVQGNIINIQIDDATVSGHPPQHIVTLWFSYLTPMDVPDNIALRLAGLSTVPSLNGLITSSTVQVITSEQLQFFASPGVAPITPFSAEGGAASTGTGVSGSTQPVWNTVVSLPTIEGGIGLQWICMGPATFPWGLPGPTVAPTVTQTPVPKLYANWQPNTWYAPDFYLVDSSAGLQQLVTAGTLGPTQPAWSAVPGTITSETSPGTAQWKCVTAPGAAAWVANTAYASGYVIAVAVNLVIGGVSTLTTVEMVAQAAGTSGPNPPSWNSGLGTTTTESTGLTWKNAGTAGGWATMGAGAKVALDQSVVDNNGYIETIQSFGETGATPPTWANVGGITKDTAATNAATWVNNGPFAPGAPGGSCVYAYSGKSSITKQVSNASPVSQPFIPAVGNMAVVQGQGLVDPPWDKLVVWRSLQGTTTPLYFVDEIPNPGPTATWTYYDNTPDQPSATSDGLNTFIQAPINGNNNPPPANFIPQCYYLNRIWGFSLNILMYSNGPDQGATAGSGDQSFTALHQFTMQSLGVACWPTSMGLLVWTNSDVWAVLGQGTFDGNGNPISPFYMVQFQQNCGLGNQDALTINGSTGYAMLNSHQVVSFDPGAGETEVGFPIGDQLDEFFNPAMTYLAWHQGRSKDTALFVADGSATWWRMAATAAPESGTVWSPPAEIAAPGKIQAIASVETSPGQRALLIGPSVNAHPILMRDLTVNADDGVPYPCVALIANVVLAQPGSGIAAVQFVVTEEAMIAGATPVQVSLLFDEITGDPSDFHILRNVTNDPPTLPPSKTVRVQRLWATQDASTVIKCRHYQQMLTWPEEDFPNELFTNTIYGRLPEKARK